MLLCVEPSEITVIEDEMKGGLVIRVLAYLPDDHRISESDYPGLRYLQDGTEVSLDPFRVEHEGFDTYTLDFHVTLYTACSYTEDTGPWTYHAVVCSEEDPNPRVHRLQFEDDDDEGLTARWGSNPQTVMHIRLEDAPLGVEGEWKLDTLPPPSKAILPPQGGEASRYELLAGEVGPVEED